MSRIRLGQSVAASATLTRVRPLASKTEIVLIHAKRTKKAFCVLFNVGFATIKMCKTRRVPLALNFTLGHIVGFARICWRKRYKFSCVPRSSATPGCYPGVQFLLHDGHHAVRRRRAGAAGRRRPRQERPPTGRRVGPSSSSSCRYFGASNLSQNPLYGLA